MKSTSRKCAEKVKSVFQADPEFFQKQFLQLCMLMVVICMMMWLSGCAMVAGEIAAQGILKARDEGAAASAMKGLKEKHPYIDFEQQFPETYLFNEHESTIWSRTLAMLQRNGESILSQDKSQGKIVTEAKQIPINEEGDSSKLGSKKIFYEQEINIDSVGSKKTHVTNRVSCYKSDKYGINKSPISLSDPENIIRGVFFGTLAKSFYPQLARQAMAGSSAPRKTSTASSGDVVHVVQSGETLGKIAAKHTGNAMDYKEIADYNNISDPAAIKVGQKLLIPGSLLK